MWYRNIHHTNALKGRGTWLALKTPILEKCRSEIDYKDISTGSRILTRKSTGGKRKNRTQKVGDGKVHQRKKQSADQPVVGNEEQTVATENPGSTLKPNSAATNPPGQVLTKKVSYGLMRLDSRRRLRKFFKWLLYLLVIAGLLSVLWYFFGDRFPWELMRGYWNEIIDKLFPEEAASPGYGTGN